MTSINISLPESLQNYLEEQVSRGGYGTISEYLRELIREDQERKAQEQLEASLLRGLESPAREWTLAEPAHIKQAVRERLVQKRNKA